MKILHVNKPMQTKDCQDPEYVENAHTIYEYIPTWCVKTTARREADGGYRGFMEAMEKDLKNDPNKQHIEGLYIYDVQALNQQLVNGQDENKKMILTEPEIIYYIRWDYIKKR